MASDDELARDQERAFALLTEVGELVAQRRGDEAAAAAARLVGVFDDRPGDAALVGFGAMVLDATLWLLAGGRDTDALALCAALIARLGEGSDSELAVAAGARFLAAQAAGALPDPDRARSELAALATMGDPALAGMERVAGRLAAAGADAAWHAQVAAATVTVLWRMGRLPEARALADESAASFARLGREDLRACLAALAAEIA